MVITEKAIMTIRLSTVVNNEIRQFLRNMPDIGKVKSIRFVLSKPVEDQVQLFQYENKFYAINRITEEGGLIEYEAMQISFTTEG